MNDLFARMVDNFDARLAGPFHLRFLLQPAVAMFFAVMDGRKDARAGNPPYGWTLLTVPERRGDLIRQGWKSVGKVFLVAIAIDVLFQVLQLHTVYVGEALLTGILLAIVPYALLRGVVTRLLSSRGASAAPKGQP